MVWLDWVLSGIAAPVALASAYLMFLAVVARRARVPRPSGPPGTRFDVIVPAHDEAAGIGRTVRSLLALDYPGALRRVVVVADNCSDDTAERARAAGAIVWERRAIQRGKGHALAYAFQRSRKDRFATAVVVVDADSTVSGNLLRSFDARLREGAQAIQAEYGVLNADDSWRTRLMRLAFALFHGVRSSARERLGLSAGLRGNGMCFTHALLEKVPYNAFSVVEDVEFGIALGLAGVRVAYAAEAEVRGEMPSDEKASRSQRARWELGRRQLVRNLLPRLLTEGLKRRSATCLELAADLVVPPLARLTMLVTLGVAASALLYANTGAAPYALYAYAFCAGAIAVYVARGWAFSRTGLDGLLALACAPAYVLWKLVRVRKAPTEWVRTERAPLAGGAAR